MNKYDRGSILNHTGSIAPWRDDELEAPQPWLQVRKGPEQLPFRGRSVAGIGTVEDERGGGGRGKGLLDVGLDASGTSSRLKSRRRD